MGVVTTMPGQKCAGCESAWVRSDCGKYCTECEEIGVQLEIKRLYEQQRNRNFGVGQSPSLCEASSFAEILAGMPLGERIASAAITVGCLGVGVGLSTIAWMGLRQVIGWLLKVSA